MCLPLLDRKRRSSTHTLSSGATRFLMSYDLVIRRQAVSCLVNGIEYAVEGFP